MASWIDHAQRFVTSEFKDHSAWEAAKVACQTPQIRKFLNDYPVKSKEAAIQAFLLTKFLEANGQIVPALMVRFLSNLQSFLILLSPLRIPSTDRESLFDSAHAFTNQLCEHRELLPSVGFLCFIRGIGLQQLNENSAARLAYEAALSSYRALAVDQSASYLYLLASTQNNLGNLLRDMGDCPDARVAIEEALSIRRKLAETNPDTYQTYVAQTLNNLCNLLSDMGEMPEAHIAIEEALSIRRKLAKTNPTTFQPEIARTLGILGELKLKNRDLSAAHTAFREALSISRNLSADNPNKFQPSLAISLHNFGLLLSEVRDFLTALNAYEEALKIRRKLAEVDPDTYQPDVARTLNNLGNVLREMRNFPAAHKISVEALDIFHQLAVHQPATYLPDEATIRNNLGSLLREIGEYPAARMEFNAALHIRRKLFTDNPDTHRPSLAMTLHNLSVQLSDVRSELPAARIACDEALEIYRQLAAYQPSTYLPHVATTLNTLGLLQFNLHDFLSARKSCEEALLIYRELAVGEPNAYQPSVAMTLNNLGNMLHEMRDIPTARSAYEEAVKLAEVIHFHDELQHLAKNKVPGAYRYLLANAAASCDFKKAFAYSVALRDGQALSGDIGQSELKATQDWLLHQGEQSGNLHRLLVANVSSDGQLVLGLIDSEDCQFVVLQGAMWVGLFPINENNENNIKRHQLARELWQTLPKMFQDALAPKPDKKQIIAISGDPFWSAFPWELLRFDEGEEDYLGLHYALPRLGAIQAKDLESQLSLAELGQNGGRTTVLAPFDTGLLPLTGVVDEIESVKLAIEMRGGHVVAFAKGSEASDLEIERQISLQPDIFYYSGHGTIVHEEELLVLHRDMSSQNALTSTTFFGKENLELLANNLKGQLFSKHPLIVLNSCLTGRSRQAGGAHEDLISTLLALGAGAVIATALPIYDVIGKALGEALFDPNIAPASDISSVIVGTRRHLAKEVCADVESPFWGAWGMIHLHGSAHAEMPFIQSVGKQ